MSSSTNVQPFLVLDDRLHCSDSIGYGVLQSGQSINQQSFTSQTISPSQITNNCLIPSLGTVIDRHVMVRNTFTLSITGCPADGQAIFTGANNVAAWNIAAFPFSKLVNQFTCQINNTTVSKNYQDTLAVSLRNMTALDLAKYQDLAPIQPDEYGTDYTNRNQFNVNTNTWGLSPYVGVDRAIDPLILPRGAFADYVLINSAIQATGGCAAGQQLTATIQITTTEPIMCSPFIFGDCLDNHNSGLYGISAMNFVFNLRDGNRALRFAYGNGALAGGGQTAFAPYQVTVASVQNSTILMTLLSPKPNQLLPLANSVPYYELPVYKTTAPAVAQTGTYLTNQLTTTIVAPNTIPDKIFIAVKKQQLLSYDNDMFMPITSINLTWNTQSGILASASLQDLYYMSKRAGYKGSYQSWIGYADTSVTANPLAAMVGGFLCLNMAEMIPIQEAYYACGSLGTWSLSATITYQMYNYNAQNIIPAVECLLILQQSGLFTTLSGSSSQYIGVLGKETVLAISDEEPVSAISAARMIGGGFLSSLKSMAPHALKAIAPLARQALASSGNKFAKMADSGLKAVGMGRQPRVRD